MAFGIHALENRDWTFKQSITVEGALTVEGNFTFGDAATDTLTVNGELQLSGVDKGIVFNATNTAQTAALTLPDDTYIADANGALGAAAGFITVKIDSTFYKLQTYAVS